jgi:proteasome lid subunit RPN8/RPN11
MGLFRSSEIVGIAESALEFARESAREAHPNEYMAQLRAQEASTVGLDMSGTVLSEIIVVPGTKTNQVSAEFKPINTPNDLSAAGSIHSHPNGVIRPSDADLATFNRNHIHIILGAPYGPEDWKAFNHEGKPVDLPVVEIEPPEEDFFDFTQEDIDEQLEDERE